MKEPVARHEKIRFRRDEVAGLHTYPSAGTQALPGKPSLVPRWCVRTAKWTGLAIAGLVAVIAALLVIIPSAGIESELLRAQAERAVARLAGPGMDARIGKTTLALDRRHFLAIGIDDVTVTDRKGNTPFGRAGRVGLGIRFWPLLGGRVEVGSATLSDARIALPVNLARPDGERRITTADGLIDPDKLLDEVFAGLESAVRRVGPIGIETIRLKNVEFVAGSDSEPLLTVNSAEMAYAGTGSISIASEIAILDHTIALTGEASANADEPASFEIKAVAANNGKTYEMGGAEPEDHGSVQLGEITAEITGTGSGSSGPANILVTAAVAQSEVTVGSSGVFKADARMTARLTDGTGALSIERVGLRVARSHFAFSGLITPQPEAEDSENGATYAFRMIGPEINVAPRESPEPALAAIARLSGWIAPNGRRIVATDINVATGQGEAIGSGALEIEPGKSPGISLAVAVSQMPVSHAKNLWPFFAAPGARRWALQNVYGGRIENSRLLLRVEPGRLGDGVPLDGEEVSGHFEIADARFDVAGTIPPMRDAVGAIDFAGTDVDIALRSGTIFTESGRMLDARDGTLTIDDAHLKPLIGNVDIRIDGDAAAVAEVAGYEPINLSRYLPISPDGISGTARGRVLASIPLQDDIEADDLDWYLELDYEGLSLAEPYEGQRIEDAKGTIVAGPDRADFVAEAKLNGIRGELTLSEPFGDDKDTRRREARLFLEAGDTDKLFDGLSTMVSGPLTIDVAQLGPGREKVSVDLANSTLTLPWIGWTKEKGVAAKAEFVMNRKGETIDLTGFELTGDGFGGAGSLTVDEGGLAKARFGRIAFSKGDNVALSIDRNGKNYAINVSGEALDARFLIDEFADVMPGTGGGGDDSGGSAGGGAASASVKVDADIARVTGFNGASIVDAKFAYTDSGGNTPGLRISAATPRGARLTIVDASAGGSRKVEVKADDAGAALRFLDVYDKLGGGRAALSLAGKTNGTLRGQLEMLDFSLIDEARLQSIVTRKAPGAERSLNDAVKRDVDVSRAQFNRGFASVEMGKGYLAVSNGVVSGPSVGSTFEGTVFDSQGNMSINGTFLPAYGINRLFGEIPLLGQLLGNGRGGGLIGITYRLSGPARTPKLEVNPLSIVAPGIFRSIFEYR